MTVNLVSSVTYDIASLCLNNQLSFLFNCLRRAFISKSDIVSWDITRSLEFVPFSVMDLLRSKCSGSAEDIKKVLRNLQEHPNI
jgi:hypothetical protein